MSISSGLYSYLAAQAAISTLVSARIYPVILPQDPTYPAITFNIDGIRDTFTFNDGQTSFVGADIQIDAWATTQKGAEDLAAAINNALQNHTGDMGGVVVNRCFREAQVDIYESTVNAYRRSLSYVCWHTE